jgi:MYXO-CTERM domain-containing protein
MPRKSPRGSRNPPSRAPVVALGASLLFAPALALAWTPLGVAQDPLVRMPGTQPAQGAILQGTNACLNCHAGYDPKAEAGFAWRGSMMALAAKDPLFWPAFTVAMQDSIYALGRPNATDLCERCHFPKGWMEGHSDPSNASQMANYDFDGVNCDGCHRMFDPFYVDTATGQREGDDWTGYWDESGQSMTPSAQAAADTLTADTMQSSILTHFNGLPLYDASHRPASPGYTENGSGQYYLSVSSQPRGPFADATAQHGSLYSRYTKSKHFCSTCHDVSNTALANAAFASTLPNDGATVLPSEAASPFSYFPLERTSSEMMLSDYGLPGGAPGIGPFAPGVFTTSRPGNLIATCQDCHMRDVSGQGCSNQGVKTRPADSVEHPKSGQPSHELTGGNALVPYLLASTVPGSPNFDATNADLLGQGPSVLTLDLQAGTPLDPTALLASSNRAKAELSKAVAISQLSYDPQTGATSFRIQNRTGHKLPSGYPDGRRMFASLELSKAGSVIARVNPYSAAAGTLAGLPLAYSPNSPALAAGEIHRDDLVFEAHNASAITGEDVTFHFALVTGFSKDNRIPPKGFRIAEAAARHAEPAWNGAPAPDHFTAAEYAGGYDDIALTLPSGGDRLDLRLHYQTISREYVEFLRDEINGDATSLLSPTPSGEPKAYIAQSDLFFSKLAAWGDTLWQLWEHNQSAPGAAPVLMTQATVAVDLCAGLPDGAPCDDADACTTGDTCKASVCEGGAPIDCADQNECTDDACDPQQGCIHGFNEAPCEDLDVCTTGDVCASGVCVAGLGVNCQDEDLCTVDACDPVAGCVHTPLANCGDAGADASGGGGSGGAGGAATGTGGSGGASTTTVTSTGGSGGAGGSPPPPDEGCSCSAPGTPERAFPGASLAFLLLLGAGRRRRHAQSD